jgi:hypothetical protein
MSSININAESKAMYGKTQASMGTPEVLSAADVVRTRNLNFQTQTGERASAAYDGGSGRSNVDRATSQTNTVSFEMDLVGGGDNGGSAIFEPPCTRFLRAAGWNSDATVANQVTFSLADRNSIDVATIAVNHRVVTNGPTDFDVDQYTTSDARGKAGLDFSSDFPKVIFSDFVGKYVEPARVLATDMGTTQNPVFVSPLPFVESSFSLLTFNSQALCAHSLAIPSLGWTQSRTDVVNCEETSLTEEKILIDITFKMLDMASENVWAWADDKAQLNYFDFDLVFDNRLGHVFKLNAKARLINPQMTTLSDGNMGIQGQLEVRDGELTFGWYSAA